MLPLAICAIFRNEAAYLPEWIEFHRLMGFERFYLYQNRSQDGWWAALRRYAETGVVEIFDWPLPSPCQLPAYQDFIGRYGGESRWVAFIDCDEFLFSPSHATVAEVLSYLGPGWGAVGVNWVCFGAAGQDRRTDGLVIERFTLRPRTDFPINRHIKSLVRMDRVKAVGRDPHHFSVHGGTVGESGEKIDGPLSRGVSSRWLRVNHYVTKSRQEYLQRIARGRSDSPSQRSVSEFEQYQAAEVSDTTILRFLPELKARLAEAA